MPRKTVPGVKTPGSRLEERVRHYHFKRDGVIPNKYARNYFKRKVVKGGCGLCGKRLVNKDGSLSRIARLDHCHASEAPTGVGFLRGYLCVSCNALEGYYKWTKVGPDADKLLASAVRRKHGVKCTKKRVTSFRKDPLRTRLF